MKTLVACAGLALILFLGGCATSTTKHPSPYFSQVASHLDMGGEVFMYADIEGDLPMGADYLDRLVNRVGKASPELHLERINVKRLLQQLGLDNLLAFGLSSTQEGKVFHNKAFFQHQGPRRGLLLLTGEAPRDLEIIRQAPGNADVVFEADIRLKSLLNLVEGILKDTLGAEAKDLLAFLDEKLPDGSLTLRKAIEQLDTRVVGVLRADIPQGFDLSSKGNSKPVTVDLLLAADNLSVLFDAADRLLQAVPTIKRSQDGDWLLLEIPVPMPEIAGLVPVLAKNSKTGRVFLASTMGFVREFLADKAAAKNGLVDSPDFKAASAGFSKQANGLNYMSGAFIPKVARLAQAFGKTSADRQMGIDLFMDLLPDAGMAFASQQVNLPDGLYYASTSPHSHKSVLFAPLLVVPVAVAGVVAATLIPSFKKASSLPAKNGIHTQDHSGMLLELGACIDAATSFHKRGGDKSVRPKSRAASPMILPPTLPIVCPNPRTSSTDRTLDGYRSLGWAIMDTRGLCFQYKRDHAKVAPRAFSCHAWIDRDGMPSTHWSAQGTWDAARGAWEVKDAERIEDPITE